MNPNFYRPLTIAIMVMVAMSSAMAQESFRATHIARLFGDGERPDPVLTPGIGIAIMRLDAAAHTLEYRISVADLVDVTAAHFHRGGIDTSGPVAQAITLPTSFGTNHTVTGVWSNISEDDLARIRRGEIYVNFHTVDNPAGEIRGQVEMIPNLTATLSPAEEVPPVEVSSSGIGDAIIVLDRVARRLDYLVRWSDLTGPPTAAHFHQGVSGVSGPPVHTITLTPGSDMAIGTWSDLSDQDINRLLDRGIYVNVHTESNPAGEIRSQVFPIEFYTAAISPTNEVNQPGNSESAGTGYMLVITQTDAFSDIAGDFIVDGTTGPVNAAHLHNGPLGVAGPVLQPLAAEEGTTTLWSIPIFTFIEPEEAVIYRSGNGYANFHTTQWPNGELRGQMVPAQNNLDLTLIPTSVRVDRQAVAGNALAATVDPGTGEIRFQVDSEARGSIVIYSSLGVRVAELSVDGGVFTTRGLPSGLYMAQLLVDGRPEGVCRVMVAR